WLRRKVLDQNGNVAHPLAELPGQRIERLFHQPDKVFPFHPSIFALFQLGIRVALFAPISFCVASPYGSAPISTPANQQRVCRGPRAYGSVELVLYSAYPALRLRSLRSLASDWAKLCRA